MNYLQELAKGLPREMQTIWSQKFSNHYLKYKDPTLANDYAWSEIKRLCEPRDGEWVKRANAIQDEEVAFMDFKTKEIAPVGEDENFWYYDVVISKVGVQNKHYKPPETIKEIPELIPNECYPCIPGVNDHPPSKDGKMVVEISDDNLKVGFFSNIEFVDNKDKREWKVKAKDAVPKSHPEIKEARDRGDYRGVSIGFKYLPEDKEGEWTNNKGEGVFYNQVEHKVRIFHIARMITQKPACTLEDGCGIGVNYEEFTNPYPNEHSARLKNPDDFDKYRRTDGGKLYNKIEVPKSISIIWGHLKGHGDDDWGPQALRFSKKSWTVEKAKAWLKENEIKYISFEAAGEDSDQGHSSDEIKLEYGTMTEKDEEKKVVKTTVQPIGVNDMDIAAIAEANPKIKALVDENKKLKEDLEKNSKEVEEIKPLVTKYKELINTQHEEMVKSLKERTDKFNDETIKNMNNEELSRLLEVLPEKTKPGDKTTSVKRLNTAGSGGTKAELEQIETFLNSVDKRDPETGKWKREGEEFLNS